MEQPFSTHLAHAVIILLLVLVASETFYRVFRIIIGDMQDKSAQPRFRKAAFTICIILAFGTIYMTQQQWFSIISTPLAVMGSWGLVKLNSVLTDRSV